MAALPIPAAERPLAFAIRHINASARDPIDAPTLLGALTAETVPAAYEHHVRAFFDEVEVETIGDLAAVANARPGLAALLAQEVADALPRTREALELQAARGTEALARSIVPTPSSAGLMAEIFAIGRRVLDDATLIAAASWV